MRRKTEGAIRNIKHIKTGIGEKAAEGLPQVLKHQMEKQLNQVQRNRLVINSSLKIFIKPKPKRDRQSKREGET